MTTLTFPLSRIEGHAQVVIEVHAGKILSTHFQATEFRGFEYLVQGVPAQQMPVITPRICGVCSTAHHVASVKALEDAFEISPPPLALTIRELLLLGQLLQNQATSLFIFTMPDRLKAPSLFQLAKEQGDEGELTGLAARALQVRKAGTDLITLAGGQFIHPIKAIIGGVTSGIEPGAAQAMQEQLKQALPVACTLFDYYWDISLQMGERLGTWGDDAPAAYISSLVDCCPNFCGQKMYVLGATDDSYLEFPPADFRKYLTYQETDYSYSDQTSYQGQVLRANSLARINMLKEMGTPKADQYLARFKETFGEPAHAIMLFDLARGIELVYAIERAMEILDQPLNDGETAVAYTPQDGEGYGLVEAPRGPLIHHYSIANGAITKAEFVIPTVHNMLAIERALQVAAERYINPEKMDMELERAVGRVVRAFDPCIACATH